MYFGPIDPGVLLKIDGEIDGLSGRGLTLEVAHQSELSNLEREGRSDTIEGG